MERPDIQSQVDELRHDVTELRTKIDRQADTLDDIRHMMQHGRMYGPPMAEEMCGPRGMMMYPRRPGMFGGFFFLSTLLSMILAFSLVTRLSTRTGFHMPAWPMKMAAMRYGRHWE